MTVTIWHNPRCSKSRATLAILEDQGVKAEIVTYLDTPPSAEQISHTLKLLGMDDPRELMRKGEAEYKENKLDNPDLTEQQLIDAMVSHPRLIERPVVFSDGKASIGRPPESVLEILPA